MLAGPAGGEIGQDESQDGILVRGAKGGDGTDCSCALGPSATQIRLPHRPLATPEQPARVTGLPEVPAMVDRAIDAGDTGVDLGQLGEMGG